MSGFSADEGASRAGSPASSEVTQTSDSNAMASGDVLLAAQIPESPGTGLSINTGVTGAEHGSASAPIIDLDPEAPGVAAALSPEVNDDAGGSFHLPAADAFWFTLDDSGSVGEDPAAAEVARPLGSGSEPTLTTQPVGLFHDAGPVDQAGSAWGGTIEPSSNATPSNNAGPIFAAPSDGILIISAPFAESTPSSAEAIPNWIINTSGTGGTSGGTGGTAGTSSITNQSSGGLVINIVYDSSVANAPAGFTADVQAVVNYFESHFSNPITITIDVGYGEVDGSSLGSGALGESVTYFDPVSYAQLQSALVANLIANGNSAAAATLPATSPVSGQWWV
ncbi:MAG: hypothetical protein ACTHJS_19990, partial [Xanthobacteraceae bacterium]